MLLAAVGSSYDSHHDDGKCHYHYDCNAILMQFLLNDNDNDNDNDDDDDDDPICNDHYGIVYDAAAIWQQVVIKCCSH